jgi:hypothetical protein
MFFIIVFSFSLMASPGRLDSNGCHNSKTEGYHCHNGRGTFAEVVFSPFIGIQKGNGIGKLFISDKGLILDGSYKFYINNSIYIDGGLSLIPNEIDFDEFTSNSGLHYGGGFGIDYPMSTGFINLGYDFRIQHNYVINIVGIGFTFIFK